MNRTDRLVAMVTYLQGRRVVRAEELAAHFEVSERTVYRDMSALSEAGVPVVGEAGVGYSLVKGYHLPPVMFTAEEAIALGVGKDLVQQFTDQSMAVPMRSALSKIRSVLPRERQDELDRLASTISVEGGGPAAEVAEQRKLLPIQQAVASRRVLRIAYQARDQKKSRRDVEPLGAAYHGDSWYLVAWCRLRGDFRHFRLNRISEIEALEERFSPPMNFSLEEHLRVMQAPLGGREVKVWFAETARSRARQESFGGFIHEESAPGGGYVVGLRTYSFDWLARWLLSFGAAAEALEPPELRHQVAELARAVAEKHQASQGLLTVRCQEHVLQSTSTPVTTAYDANH
jgi:predicted DNA-binding transcriptional regulator YafY